MSSRRASDWAWKSVSEASEVTVISEKQFRVEIITPERLRYEGSDAALLTVPGEEGQMGLMANHAPLLALLRPGPLTLRTRNHTYVMAVGAGFVKMNANHAVCLVDFAEPAEEIDGPAATRRQATLQSAVEAAGTEEERAALRGQLAGEQARLDVLRIASPHAIGE